MGSHPLFTPQSPLKFLTGSAATAMTSLVVILLLPLMAAAAPKNQERGFLGDFITGPIDLAQCMGKCPVNPLEFAKCSVECAKGSEERGLLGDLITKPVDLAQCIGKCPINPLEFAKCSVECAKGPEEKNRGLMRPCCLRHPMQTEPRWRLQQWPSWSSQ